MKNMLNKTLVTVLVLSGSMVFAQEIRTSVEIETSCRIKAKEIAANTYRTCVMDQKNSQIGQIKKEYQAKLQALKAHYEAELKKMVGTKPVVEPKAPEQTVETVPTVAPETAVAEPVSESIQAEAVKTEEVKTETVEKAVKTQKPAPLKKSAVQKSTVMKPAVSKKTVMLKNTKPVKIEKQAVIDTKATEMTVQLKQSPAALIRDASGELPEPIPVEMTQDSAI